MTKPFRIDLGKTTSGLSVLLDATTLLNTRMLVTGSSGSGKSYAIRVLAERFAPKIQTIVIDPEGEFASLREKIDLVLVGSEGEIKPSVATAAKLARKLLELEVSAVIDLYDLKIPERRAFVRRFIDSMMSVPKSLWKPCFMMIDEVHKFCPERGGTPAESTDSVITLLSQGRKRGFAGILSTQRLTALHNDAAAECLNRMVGRTILDVDVVRARKMLGMANSDDTKIRNLEPGQWFGYGPALVDREGEKFAQVAMFQSAKAATTHPDLSERRTIRPPAPSNKIRRFVPQFADLPSAPDESPEGLRLRIAELEAELSKAKRPASRSAPPPALDRDELRGLVDRAVLRETQAAEARHRKELAAGDAAHKKTIAVLQKEFGQIDKCVTSLLGATNSIQNILIAAADKPVTVDPPEQRSPPRSAAPINGVDVGRDGGMRRILIALATLGGEASRRDVAIVARLVPTSGTFSTYLGRLKKDSLIEGRDQLQITKLGYQELGSFDPVPEPLGAHLVQIWRDEIGGGGLERMFDALVAAGERGLDRVELAHAAVMEASSGTFSTYVGRLRKKGIFEDRKWPMRLSGIFFHNKP